MAHGAATPWERIEIEPQWPHWRLCEQPSTNALAGATIVQIGRPTLAEKQRIYGDEWLVIDYRPAGAAETRRLVLQFNELAMWVEADVPMSETAARSSPVARS
jgi:hypothetical protein